MLTGSIKNGRDSPMTIGYQFDVLQTAIDRGIRDSIVKDGIASGEFTRETHPDLIPTSPPTEQLSLGKALAGAAMVAVGGLLMNWLTPSTTNE